MNSKLIRTGMAAFMACFALSAWADTAYTETVAATTGSGIVQFSELDLTPITCFTDKSNANIQVRANRSTDDNSIVIRGVKYESGVGTHAPSKAFIQLNGATSFYAIMGVDDEADETKTNEGNVDYNIVGYKDSKTNTVTLMSGSITRRDEAGVEVNLTDLSEYKYLLLEYAAGTNTWSDHCDWADARFTYTGEKPVTVAETDMFVEESGIVQLPTQGANGEEIIPLSSLDLNLCTNGWGAIKKDKSIDGNTITIGGTEYASGVGIHATAFVGVKLNGAVTAFHAIIGIDDEVLPQKADGPSVDAKVVLRAQNGSEKVVAEQTISGNGVQSFPVDITEDLSNWKYLLIYLDKGAKDSYDHVDIANAYFEYLEQNSTRPEMVAENSFSTSLDCATILFSQPGVRFMHKLHSNNPDAIITVEDLPAGLEFNEGRCLVDGTIDVEGEYTYTAVITLGEDSSRVPCTLTVSKDLQQPVPFMGWLSWNAIEDNISEDVVKAAADAMVDKGLVAAGYNYLVMDDVWHDGGRNGSTANRTSDGKPVADPAKFPNGVKACADYVHAKGMKFGIYSDAAAKTCAGAFGSFGYEEIDAKQYAEWECDLLKYDYCGAPADQATAITRYTTMGEALKNSGRNILFYICEWGVREPWKWGDRALGSTWRCTYDTRDCWVGVNGGIGITQSIAGMKDIWMYNGVNRWNDADMMCIGLNGTGKSSSHLCQKAGMTKNEYRTQMALWCMWASPLTLSNDMTKEISKVDLEIMTNEELIAINQDRMGQAGQNLAYDADGFYVMSKDLENGDVAISVTNLASASASYTFDLSKVPGLDGVTTYKVRDLVNKKDMDNATATIECPNIPTHATRVYRLSAVESGIQEVGVNGNGKLSVSAKNGAVKVCLPAAGSKRVLVSDIAGHVLATATSADQCITLPVNAPKGIYVVNVVCNGRSQSVKVTL